PAPGAGAVIPNKNRPAEAATVIRLMVDMVPFSSKSGTVPEMQKLSAKNGPRTRQFRRRGSDSRSRSGQLMRGRAFSVLGKVRGPVADSGNAFGVTGPNSRAFAGIWHDPAIGIRFAFARRTPLVGQGVVCWRRSIGIRFRSGAV